MKKHQEKKDEKLSTESPITEKDEVKKAEDKTRKAQEKASKDKK